MKCLSAFNVAIVAVTAATIHLPVKAAPNVQGQPSQRLTIRIYDYAGVPGKELARAFDETERIYRKAGIKVTLVRCRVALTDPILDASCSERHRPSVISVRVLPEEMASRAHADKRVFGIAATAERPHYGVVANVFYERVARLAAEWDYRGYLEGVVLGHVLVHEVGHLLLGTGSHTRRGIMRIPWGEPELFSAHTGALVFTPEQSAILRREVAARSLVMRANITLPVVPAENQAQTAARPGM